MVIPVKETISNKHRRDLAAVAAKCLAMPRGSPDGVPDSESIRDSTSECADREWAGLQRLPGGPCPRVAHYVRGPGGPERRCSVLMLPTLQPGRYSAMLRTLLACCSVAIALGGCATTRGPLANTVTL